MRQFLDVYVNKLWNSCNMKAHLRKKTAGNANFASEKVQKLDKTYFYKFIRTVIKEFYEALYFNDSTYLTSKKKETIKLIKKSCYTSISIKAKKNRFNI